MAIYDENPGMFRKQAHEIASNKGARQAWADLKEWASGRGPLAMRSAMAEFLFVHGRSPEAASVMPELMMSSSRVFTPKERGELFQISSRPDIADLRPKAGQMKPKASLPMSVNRPTPSLSFGPPTAKPRLMAVEPLSPVQDHAYLRDTPIRIRDQLALSLGKPPLPVRQGESSRNEGGKNEGDDARRFDSGKSPDSFYFGASGGEHIVRALTHKLRAHGRDEAPHLSSAPSAPAGRARKAKPRKTGKKRPRTVKKAKKRKGRGK